MLSDPTFGQLLIFTNCMAYIINLILVIIYYFIICDAFRNNIVKRNKCFAIVVGIHAILFRALANPFGYVDTELYDEGFRSIAQMTFSEAVLQVNFYTHWGTGYVLFNWIISRFTDDSKYLFIIASVFSIFPVIWFYFKTSKKLLPAVLIFLLYPMMYIMGFGVIRQHMSVAYILLALYYVDRLKISIPLAILAISLHTSGIVFLPYYLFRRIDFSKNSNEKVVIYVLFVIGICRFSMNYVLSYMPKYAEIVDSKESENNIVPALWLGGLLLTAISSKLNRRLLSSLEKDVFLFFIYGTAMAIFCIGLPGMGRFTICFLYVVPIISSFFYTYTKGETRSIVTIINIIVIVRQLYYKIIDGNFDPNYIFIGE